MSFGTWVGGDRDGHPLVTADVTNRTLAHLHEQAVALIKGRVLVEVSGNVGRQDLRPLAATGVDIISVGALTHGARCVDISMRITVPA